MEKKGFWNTVVVLWETKPENKRITELKNEEKLNYDFDIIWAQDNEEDEPTFETDFEDDFGVPFETAEEMAAEIQLFRDECEKKFDQFIRAL
ncbi:unnamed protein product, partial [Oikopleura dioica]